MDVENTIQFILDRQAKIESDFDVMRHILLDTTKVQAEQGRTLVRIEDSLQQFQLTTEHAIRELFAANGKLAAAQEVTERKLQAFIDSLSRGPNVH